MNHLSTLDLHKLRLGELEPPHRDDAEAHLASCARCTERMAVARDEERAFDTALPPALAAALAEPSGEDVVPAAPAAPVHWMILLRRLGPAGVSLLAAALVLLVASTSLTAPPPESTGVRTRGEIATLEVWIDSAAGVRPLRAGETLASGDRVQLLYHPHGAERVGIAGRDSTGVIEVYGVLTPTKPGLQPAPFGLAMDDAAGNQEFFVVTGGRSLDERRVKEAIGRGVSTNVTRLVIPKEAATP